MKPSSAGIFSSLTIAVLLTTFGGTLLVAAMLKETPVFWRNAGGYPEALRDLVLIGFYPAYGVYFLWLIFGSLTGWKLLRAGHRAGAILLLTSVLNGLLFTAITTVVIWNNLENLLQNHPLHFHAP